VYVSTPNGLHFEWAAKAIRAGKHVLVEKPFTANGDEAKRLVELARERGVIVEEAVCFLPLLLEWLGRLRRC
jgi:predicted dehydrogenase